MIENYSFGEIKIDGKTYRSDVIIYKDRVDDNWWREAGHSLSLKDIAGILNLKPEVLIIGTGESGCLSVPQKIKEEIEAKGIKVVIKRTEEACEEYNKTYKNRDVIAALHLTC